MARVWSTVGSMGRRTRFGWGAVVALLTVALLAPAAVAGADTTWVPSADVADGSGSTPASTSPRVALATLPQRGSIEHDATRDLVYVGEADRIEVFSTYAQLVATVPGVGPVGPLEVLGNRLYVAESAGIAVVDLDSFTVVKRVGTGVGTVWSLVAQDGVLYVGSSVYGIARIDPVSGVTTGLTGPVLGGSTFQDPILLPGASAGALVSVEHSGRVAKLQVSGTTVTSVGVYTPPSSVTTDSAALEPGSDRVWMSGPTAATARGVSLTAMTAVGPVDGGVINTGSGTVLAARGGTTPLVATAATGQIAYHRTTSPYASAGSDTVAGKVQSMAFDPDGQALYVAGIQNAGPPNNPYLQVVFPDGTPGGGFHPLPGTRLLDTRSGIGAPVGALGAGRTLDLQVTGRGGVPSSGVSAVVLNMTVTEPTGGGFLTVYPKGVDRPTASSLNFVPGQTVANLVTVSVGDLGRVTVFNSWGATHVLADVAGWYDDDGSGATFHPLSPGRVLDTRDGTNTQKAPLGPGAVRNVTIAGLKGVPASGASAVVLNLTATDATTGGFVTAWPKGQQQPSGSNVNIPAGDTRPNLVVVPLGADGAISLYNRAGSMALVADVVGWFGTQSPAGSVYVPLSPIRIVDTRDVGLPLGPGLVGSLPLAAYLPSDATAVVLNVTAVNGTSPSYLTVYPQGTPPVASNLNWRPGQVNPNQVVVPLGSDGSIRFFNQSGLVHVVVDLAGIYVG